MTRIQEKEELLLFSQTTYVASLYAQTPGHPEPMV